jgi:hypothetical protein
MSTSLKERAMVVTLRISMWGAKKKDSQTTREIEVMHNAKDAGNWTKYLMKSEKLAAIDSLSRQARDYHRSVTLAWGDGKERLLDNQFYFEYVSTMGNFRIRLEKLWEDFFSEYNEKVQSEKDRLQGMYNEADYPTEQEIRGKFGYRVSFLPIADAQDFRVKIADNMVEDMRNNITSEINSRIEKTKEDLIERARLVVTRMVETLGIPNKGFHDTMVGNIENLVETLPLLNFTDDEHIVKVTKMLSTLCVDSSMLKENPSFREEIYKRAKDVLGRL